jgi:diguanylate cyclase (GGDEF)-like protein
MASATLLVPLALIGFAQALRQVYRQPYGYWRWRSAAFGLLIAAFAGTVLEVPYVLAYAAMVSGFAMIECELAYRVWKVSRKRWLDWALLAVLMGVVAVEASRLVVVPSILGLDMGFAELRTSDVDRTYLVVLGALELLAIVLIIVRVAAWALADIRFRAERDYLTGLYNRGTFEYLALDSIRREPGVLILADLDHFKRINDRYGHDMGDGAICVFADVLEKATERRSVCGRIGGEEFALHLPLATLEDAADIAERLRGSFAQACRESLSVEEDLSASMGCAEHAAGEDLSAIMQRADEALYRAKEKGRNRVELAERLAA